MKATVCFLLCAFAISGATYSVKAGGGGNYTTIQACANAMSNGDTCVVYAGTYNEHVSLSAGAVGAYKTLQVNGSDFVYVYDFTVNSHNKIVGFHIQNPSSPASSDCIAIWNNATDVYIMANNLYACGYHAMISGRGSGDVSTYVYIRNNTLSHSCSVAGGQCRAMNITGDYHLVEYNDISHVSDGLNLAGNHNVIRQNQFHDVFQSECDSSGGNNCHIDFIESEPSQATQYNVIESNTITNHIGNDAHAFLLQATYCKGQCSNVIVRFNVGVHVGSGGILADNAGDSVNPGFFYAKSYNNSWIDFNNNPGNRGVGAGTHAFTYNSKYGSVINDLFYYPGSVAYFFPYSTDSSTTPTFSARNNLAWCTGTCDFRGGLYSAEGMFKSVAPGNLVADPKFADYAGNDFILVSGSPAIAAGAHLATVAPSDSGSGTSLILNDASFFQDGFGLAGVKGDCISITTPANQVCVAAVNYQMNTVTLASNMVRSPGDRVWLYSDSTGKRVLTGNAPHIGATLPSSLAAPTAAKVTVQ